MKVMGEGGSQGMHTSLCPSVYAELPRGTATVAVHYLHCGIRTFLLRLGHCLSHPCWLQVRRAQAWEGGHCPVLSSLGEEFQAKAMEAVAGEWGKGFCFLGHPGKHEVEKTG